MKETRAGIPTTSLVGEYHALSDCSNAGGSGMFVTICSHVSMGSLLRVSCKRDAGIRCFCLRQIEHAVITEQKWPRGFFRAVLRGRLRSSPRFQKMTGEELLGLADSSRPTLLPDCKLSQNRDGNPCERE